MKIYIDAGHGGDSIGASYNGREEQDDCLNLALAVRDILKYQKDIEVKMSRETDVNPDLTGRCKEANAWGADYFISIHRNAAAKNNTASGVEAWVYSKCETNGDTYNKAATIVGNIAAAGGYKNRGVYKGAPGYTDFAVNRVTNMSSCLLEVGFINTDADNAIFDTKFPEIVLGIAQGLIAAVNGKYLPLGDVNGDGQVTAEDARIVMRESVGYDEGLDDAAAQRADVDKDGKITSADAREILRESVGLEDI